MEKKHNQTEVYTHPPKVQAFFVHSSQFTVHSSQFPVPSSQFPVPSSQLRQQGSSAHHLLTHTIDRRMSLRAASLVCLWACAWVACSLAFPTGAAAAALTPHGGGVYGGSMTIAAVAVRRPAPTPAAVAATPMSAVTVMAHSTGFGNRWQRLALTMRRSSYGGGRSNKGDRSGGRGPGLGALRGAPSGPFGIALTATNALLGLNAAVFLAAKQFPALVRVPFRVPSLGTALIGLLPSPSALLCLCL